MSTIDTNAFIGAELIQRAALLVLFDGLNDAIIEVQSIMDSDDENLAERLGRDYVATVLETVESENFNEGYRPTLISAPIENYPNVSVYVNRVVAGPGSEQLDQQDVYHDQLVVELMAKSETDSTEVNRRIRRMTEATNLTFKADPTLSGVISGFQNVPSVIFGEVFTRKETTAYGPHWFWQGARMEYIVRKNAVSAPANLTGTGGLFSVTGLGLDQG